MERDPSISIHLVTAANAALLDRVDPDVFDHPVHANLLAQFLAQPANVLAVAIAEGVVVGMASGFSDVHPDKPLSLFLNEVGVSARFQRRGIASRLIAAVLDHARSIGCCEAWVATEVDNLPARELYRRTGAREDAQYAVVYVYTLDSSA